MKRDILLIGQWTKISFAPPTYLRTYRCSKILVEIYFRRSSENLFRHGRHILIYLHLTR